MSVDKNLRAHRFHSCLYIGNRTFIHYLWIFYYFIHYILPARMMSSIYSHFLNIISFMHTKRQDTKGYLAFYKGIVYL
ncbi:hypothetical protein HMPREF0080_00109 [Anaeroglobus geminatus F0357]|uniref:Uncharacterized protein n=1 Tax=Anaeroglobus geminatus F0357 TaxID=861450 RepID=G9YEQ1_9FIRM|nr:hypothetical protein HMPREF0080_00109 [Anaeroglobus geminatus F0357]